MSADTWRGSTDNAGHPEPPEMNRSALICAIIVALAFLLF
jgi:hypothetical protein